MLWATISRYDPQWPKRFTLWPTMTQNIVNCLTLAQNKLLGLFIFLHFVPKILFRAKLVPKHESALFKIKIDSKWCSRVMILTFTIVFLIFVPKIPVLGKFGLKTSNWFVWNENPYKDVFGNVDSKCDNCFS